MKDAQARLSCETRLSNWARCLRIIRTHCSLGSFEWIRIIRTHCRHVHFNRLDIIFPVLASGPAYYQTSRWSHISLSSDIKGKVTYIRHA